MGLSDRRSVIYQEQFQSQTLKRVKSQEYEGRNSGRVR